MRGATNCQLFRDRLDDLVEGRIASEEEAKLRRHAANCGECAMQLRVREHLAGPSSSELERAVPDDLVKGMWPSLEPRIRGGRRMSRRSLRTRGWLIPTLAAASLLLMVGNGYLLMEVDRLRERSSALAERVERQARGLGELRAGTPTDPRAWTAELAGRSWRRALAGRGRMSVTELRDLLGTIPSGTTLIAAERMDDLTGGFLRLPELVGGLRVAAVDVEDGLQAGELLRLLDTLKIDPDRSFGVSRILETYGLAPPPGRGL